MRADFYAHCARHVRLAAAMQDAQVLVGPMSSDELVRAGTQPALRAGLMAEKTLVTTVVREASERPGALPFLSHALWETWRRRRGNGLFLASYEAAGGMDGAVAQSADRVYDGLDERQRRAMRTVLLRLTALGEGTEDTRRRIDRAELAAARLLTLAEDTVEIAHEALIRGWPTLREWLTEDREALRAHRRLGEAAAEWERNGRDEAYLYRGSALAAWRDVEPGAANEAEQAFLAASIARQDRDRTARRRRLRASLVGVVVIAVVVGVLAAWAVFQTDRAADERDLAVSRQLALSARSQLDVDPELALLLAIEAVEVAPTAEADAVLRQAVVDHRTMATLPTGHGVASGVAISPDGRRIATSGEDNAIRLTDLSGQSDPTFLRGHRGAVRDVAFSPDGTYLASVGEDGTLRLWSAVGPVATAVAPVKGTGSWTAAFTPDGTHVLTAHDDGTVRRWRIGDDDAAVVCRQDEGVYDLAVSPGGEAVASIVTTVPSRSAIRARGACAASWAGTTPGSQE